MKNSDALMITLRTCAALTAGLTWVGLAEGAPPASAVPRPRQAAVAPNASPGDDKTAAADIPKFTSEDKWGMAGYNNNEIYYAVFVTNQDTRIIRCTTEIHGYYFDNGTKLSIADRQITTLFPNQPTQVGIWMDMDQSSGATYAVKCHAV
jgi:hypothetical protein